MYWGLCKNENYENYESGVALNGVALSSISKNLHRSTFDAIDLEMVENNKVIIPIHKPGLKEKLFFCFSGLIVSIPITPVNNNFDFGNEFLIHRFGNSII
jgi:hypothetical protein